MKTTVLILSKTTMGAKQVCVGGLTLEGRYVRLLDKNGHNQPANTDLSPRQGWEIEFTERNGNVPPHIEDILVHSMTSKGTLKEGVTIKSFLEKRNIPKWHGSPDMLFDQLLQWTSSGSAYIDKTGGIPNHSVGFWLSDKDLKRKDFHGVRYQYPSTNGWRSIKYKGLEDPVDILPAGTLIRVSLARWHSFDDDDDEEEKCWLQLSGWYDLDSHSDEADDIPF